MKRTVIDDVCDARDDERGMRMTASMRGRRGFVAMVLIVGAARSVQVQGRPLVEMAGGYQFLKLQSEDLDAAGISTWFPLGWFAEAAAHVSSGLALVAQLGGHYRSESASLMSNAAGIVDYSVNVHTVLGGARIIARREDGLTGFVHVLAGATRIGLATTTTTTSVPPAPLQNEASSSELAMQIGGGFDFPLTSRWSGRMTADYLRVFNEGEPTTGFRVAVGWVVPLSRR
jgi:hypothetical protein